MAVSAQELITRTYLLLNAIESGASPTPAELSDGLFALNEMLANWAEQTIIVPFRTEDIIPLVGNKTVYTWGIGGDINSARPVEVQTAWLQTPDKTSYPFEILMRLREYAQISLKTASSRPDRAWYVTTYPLGTLTLDSSPDGPYSLHVWSIKEFSEFSTLSSTSELPNSYTRALRYNLALEIGAELGAEIDPRTVEIAKKSLQSIKTGNLARRVNNLSTDNALRGQLTSRSYDIRLG